LADWAFLRTIPQTNTFSPIPTPFEAFGPHGGPLYGDDAYRRFRDTGTAVGGLIDVAEEAGARVNVAMIARSMPSAPVSDAAYQAITARLCESVSAALAAGRCDALLLELHGAMVTESLDRGEGPLLARLRRLAAHLPIAVSLDFHANVDHAMATLPTSVAAYKTFPHLDMRDCGRHTARIALDAMAGRVQPVVAWGNVPVLVHLQRMDTGQPPWTELIAMAREAETRRGVLAVSVLGGFPLADTREAGLSCIAVTDADPPLARAIRDSILRAAWERRHELVLDPEPLRCSVARARALAGRGRPVLLLDVSDTCNSGGPADGVSVLREVLAQGLEGVAAVPVCDPRAVAMMLDAGVGTELEIELGDKVAAPSIRATPAPLRLRGTVRATHDGPLTVQGPVFTGTKVDLGPTVAFESGPLEIVVTSRRAEPYDPGFFRCVGIEPLKKRFLVLKSRMQCKPAFLPLCAGHVDCNAPGVTGSDYSLLRYTRLRRPIFPLDPRASWKPESER